MCVSYLNLTFAEKQQVIPVKKMKKIFLPCFFRKGLCRGNGGIFAAPYTFIFSSLINFKTMNAFQ